MMGNADPQKNIWHTVQLEDLVPANHPLRKIRPLIDADRIRELCKDLYSDVGRPSIPPEQLFLAMLGGYLLGVRSDRKLVMELQCNMAFRWFVGLDIDSPVWDSTTFSKNREHRFDKSDVLERLFDGTVETAMKDGLVSTHWSVDGTLVRANASHKSFAPIEVYQGSKDYRDRMAGKKKAKRPKNDDEDKGNPSVDFRGQKRSNKTHRSKSDPDARFATKSAKDGAQPSYTVNGVMENRNRILVGIGVEVYNGKAERDGALGIIDRTRDKLGLRPKTLGADKAYFTAGFIEGLLGRSVKPHIAVYEKWRQDSHNRVRRMQGGVGYGLSQRARKKIEELWGEAKDNHGFRRFMRRTIHNVRQEALMMGWLLNLKRLAACEARVPA